MTDQVDQYRAEARALDLMYGGAQPSSVDVIEHARKLVREREAEGRHLLDSSPEELAPLLANIEEAVSSVGLKYDRDKGRWDLLPFKAISSVVDVLTYGAKKYSAWNWLKVENAHERYFAAAQRHLVAYRLGEKDDPETGLPHLAHAACCILFMLGLDVGETGPR